VYKICILEIFFSKRRTLGADLFIYRFYLYIYMQIMPIVGNFFQLLKNIVFLVQYWRRNNFQQKKRMIIKYVFLEIFFSC
jgi:hypothetical protein